ncbi:TRAP transporter permease [Candidatus Formimonas warabiya]|uniref:TRAP C4-dicarboxylate transport system permease DctM subunit domain-containing protein n=1 Tax=Formimonas warabiya TaxID=1761012 RepID=A0A3G1KMP0_FORW1|nr:TRAP transporter fused permease subunit [Candidatus Formimonas warabiya]ATW23732.1 hypothetical protein DCMF_02010 [Candidatus Formimonas warabiya]
MAEEKNMVQKILLFIAGLTSLYQLVVASRVLTHFNIFLPEVQHKAISLLFAVILIFGFYALNGSKKKGFYNWYDYFFVIFGIISTGFVVFNYDAIQDYTLYGYLDFKGMLLTILLMIVLLEAVRRVTGKVIPILVLLSFLMTLYQNYLPGILYGKGFPLDRLTFSIYAGNGGIFGKPLGVAVTVLITFIAFGQLFSAVGGGKWFLDFAVGLTGWMRGGPAKAAVVASCLFGMISGSPSANVATTGMLTIPLMKETGYPSRLAGAIEAVAATGGQFMPPVMGAVIFIMAEWLQIAYAEIIKYAIVPALLYYVILFMSVHCEAVKLDLKPVARYERSTLLNILKSGWTYLITLAVLLYYLLVKAYPPEMAATYSIIVMIALSFLLPDKEKHLTIPRIWQALISTTKSWLLLAAVTASIGMLIGSLQLSGLGVKFSTFIVSLTGGNLLATLILVGVACFILGMGLDSMTSYMTLAILIAPALVKIGLPPIAAHLYIIYWAMSSFITPPVCLSVYVACGISGSDLWETGWEAVKLGIGVFIVPFLFVYNPYIMLQGPTSHVIAAVGSAFLGSILIAAGIRGAFISKISIWRRVVLIIASLILMGPTNVWTFFGGLILVFISLFNQFRGRKLEEGLNA